MALSRLLLKDIQQKLLKRSTTTSLLSKQHQSAPFDSKITQERQLSTDSSDDKSLQEEYRSRETTTEKGGRKKTRWSPFPISLRRKGKGGGDGGLWRKNQPRDVDPFDLRYIFPSGLGDALLEASENFNRALENLNLAPAQVMGRMKELDDCYKIKYEVPGLGKEDIKITVEDGVLYIKGEHKEEEESSSEDEGEEQWSSYRSFNASFVLPDDAKGDEVKAELKDGVLCIIIPKTERTQKEVKEVQIQ